MKTLGLKTIMTSKPDKEKRNYERDGMCYANALQQRECKNYCRCTDSIYEFCKWQGIGTVCDFEEEK
jgi:hypothetical protein